MRWVLAGYLEDVSKSWLRFEDNQALFLLLTLKGDPKGQYRVAKLHPMVCD